MLCFDLCDVSSIALADAKYFMEMKQAYYDRIVDKDLPIMDNESEPVHAVEGADALNSFMGLISGR